MAQDEFDEFAGFTAVDGSQPPATDEFEDFLSAGATPEDKGTTLLQGIVGGAAEFGPIIPGAIAGAKLGALATRSVVGAFAGGVTGGLVRGVRTTRIPLRC